MPERASKTFVEFYAQCATPGLFRNSFLEKSFNETQVNFLIPLVRQLNSLITKKSQYNHSTLMSKHYNEQFLSLLESYWKRAKLMLDQLSTALILESFIDREYLLDYFNETRMGIKNDIEFYREKLNYLDKEFFTRCMNYLNRDLDLCRLSLGPSI